MTASPRPASDTSPLRTVRRDDVAWLTLERPAVGNLISAPLAQAICTAVENLELDDTVTLVVIEASGEHFCLGVEAAREYERQIDCIAAIARLTVPVIAAIDGDAIAEGFELALACDLRVMSDRARLQLPQLGQGRLPSHGGTQRLPRCVGRMRALDLLLTGRVVDAAEAETIGLATRVFPTQTFNENVRRLVSDLAAKGPVALRYAKEAVLQGLDLSLDQGIRLEQDLYVLLQTTADRAEGVRAFIEKRQPKFIGS